MTSWGPHNTSLTTNTPLAANSSFKAAVMEVYLWVQSLIRGPTCLDVSSVMWGKLYDQGLYYCSLFHYIPVLYIQTNRVMDMLRFHKFTIGRD